MKRGVIYMIPCPIADHNSVWEVLPESNRKIMDSLDYFIVENTRSARRFLSKAGVARPIEELEFVELNEHTTSPSDVERMLKPILEGRSAGVISEAGVPGIADPGADIVALAHRNGIRVVPLVGPSSIVMVMMASGQNGQSFAFVGYLPIKEGERAQRIKQLERRAQQENQAQIFIEAPYRNLKLMDSLLKTLSPKMRLSVAADITSENEYIVTRTIEEWKRSPKPEIEKRPTIFVLGI